MKEGSVVYLRIWSVYCRSTGCPGSRSKGEFKSWPRRGTVAKNRTQESASRPSLEGVILLSLDFASFSIYFRGPSFTQNARPGKKECQFEDVIANGAKGPVRDLTKCRHRYNRRRAAATGACQEFGPRQSSVFEIASRESDESLSLVIVVDVVDGLAIPYNLRHNKTLS